MNIKIYSFGDILNFIIFERLYNFLIIFFTFSIIFTILIIFSQRSFITSPYYKYNFEVSQLDEESNPEAVLFDKLNLIMQKGISSKIQKNNEIKDETFFFDQLEGVSVFFPELFNKDKIYLKFIKYMSDPEILDLTNKISKTKLEFIELKPLSSESDIVTLSNFKTLLQSRKSENIEIFLNNYNKEIHRMVTKDFKKLQKVFEVNNKYILNNIINSYEDKLKLLESLKKSWKLNDVDSQQKAISFEYYLNTVGEIESSINSIKSYLNKLDSSNNEYIGSVISDLEINIAKFSNVKIVKLESNLNFIYLRSTIIGIFLSFIITFFIYLVIFGFSRK